MVPHGEDGGQGLLALDCEDLPSLREQSLHLRLGENEHEIISLMVDERRDTGKR